MSTAKFNEWQNPDGTENYKTRAWVNFNGTGTVAIRASGNVASITDNGVGNYTVNFATAMPDANYAVQGLCKEDTGGVRGNTVLTLFRQAAVAGSCRVTTVSFSGVVLDELEVYVAIFR